MNKTLNKAQGGNGFKNGFFKIKNINIKDTRNLRAFIIMGNQLLCWKTTRSKDSKRDICEAIEKFSLTLMASIRYVKQRIMFFMVS